MANDLTAFEAEFWRQRLVDKLDQVNIAMSLANRDWEGDLQRSKTVHIRTAGNVSMAPYTPGTPISYQDLAPTDETFTVNDASYFAFEVDDVNAAQNDISALDTHMARALVALNNAVDAKVLSAYVNVPVANRLTGAAAAALTLDSSTSMTTGIYPLFTRARAIQSKNNVPAILGWRWAVVDPDTTTLLLNDTDHFVKSNDLGSNVVQAGLIGGEEVARAAVENPGFIGTIAGYFVYETPQLPVAAGAKYILFGDRMALTYVAQITSMEVQRLQTQFATAVRGLLLHDVFVAAENAKRLVYIKALAA